MFQYLIKHTGVYFYRVQMKSLSFMQWLIGLWRDIHEACYFNARSRFGSLGVKNWSISGMAHQLTMYRLSQYIGTFLNISYPVSVKVRTDKISVIGHWLWILARFWHLSSWYIGTPIYRHFLEYPLSVISFCQILVIGYQLNSIYMPSLVNINCMSRYSTIS